MSLLPLLLFGVLLGLLSWPYQLLSELGFRLQQQLWLLPGLTRAVPAATAQAGAVSLLGPGLVFVGSFLTVLLAWGPLRQARGGGVAPVLALQDADASAQPALLEQLALHIQWRRLLLMLCTHCGGLSVGIESPSASLGAAVLLAVRRRWPAARPLAGMPLPLVAAIGGGAGLGAAFQSPLLGAAYALEELSRDKGLSLVLPTLLLAGTGAALSSSLGQPADLAGLRFGSLPASLWPLALAVAVLAAALGCGFVRLLIPLAAWVARHLRRRRVGAALALALALTLIALVSGGLSLNDGGLSLAAALQGQSAGDGATWLWRALASLLSIAAGAPGGLMHDTMTLGALLVAPLQAPLALPAAALAQLAAVGAVALFAGASGTPIFCALFVFTLQGDPQVLPLLLLVSAIAAALAERWRGPGWNEQAARTLLNQR